MIKTARMVAASLRRHPFIERVQLREYAILACGNWHANLGFRFDMKLLDGSYQREDFEYSTSESLLATQRAFRKWNATVLEEMHQRYRLAAKADRDEFMEFWKKMREGR
jgi:hypothetical protein